MPVILPVADAGARNAAGREDAVSANSNVVDNASSSSRWDVFSALYDATRNNLAGRCCAAGRADGTAAAPALPAAPGLSVGGVGRIPLPIAGATPAANVIMAHAWEVEDKSYHRTFQIEPRQLRIHNPAWETSLKQVVKTAAYKLGLDPDKLTAKLDSESISGKNKSQRATRFPLTFSPRSASVHGQR